MSTRTALELEATIQRAVGLRAQLAAEETAKAAVTHEVRELAVALHTLLCPDEHPAGCGWHFDPAADDPEGADWTQEEHRRWLGRARSSLGWMIHHGWTLIPPGQTQPLPELPDATS